MKRTTACIASIALWLGSMLFAALPAYANGSCGGAPLASGQEGIAVTWNLPTPKQVKVAQVDTQIFNAVNQALGSDLPQDFPSIYTQNLLPASLFALNEMNTPVKIFEPAIVQNQAQFGVLVEHPKVAHPEDYTACSVVLQRGAIIYDNAATSKPKETIVLQGYFHIAKDADRFVNFVPRGAIELSLSSPTIWFPFAELQGMPEPASYVVLDILTPELPRFKRFPEAFQIEQQDQLDYQGKHYSVTRIRGKLTADQTLKALNLEI